MGGREGWNVDGNEIGVFVQYKYATHKHYRTPKFLIQSLISKLIPKYMNMHASTAISIR